MKDSMEKLVERMARYLSQQGLNAVTAWPTTTRPALHAPIVVVSLRGCSIRPAGFQSYLGERYNPTTQQWEEFYGRKAEITLGLDLYQPSNLGEETFESTFQSVAQACSEHGPEGITIKSLSCKESGYDKESRLRKREVQAVCSTWLYSVRTPEGIFTDFEIRGERSI